MQPFFTDRKGRVINDKESISFSSFSSFHLLVIRIRDTKNFILHVDQEIVVNVKPAHALQTIYLISFLKGKNHVVRFEKKQKNGLLTLENIEVFGLSSDVTKALEVNSQAEDGERRPWVTCFFHNLPLRAFTFTIIYSRRKNDSDDVKLIVDGMIRGNLLKTIKYRFWHLVGSFLPVFSPTKTEVETVVVNFPSQSHIIEFIADRMPFFHNLTFDFGIPLVPPIRIPTVDNPVWTGNFYDDNEDMILARLLLGEAESESQEVKMRIGGSILNRAVSPSWPNTVHEVILQPGQYDPFKSSDINFVKITNPLNNVTEERVSAWRESYEVAHGLLSGEVKNPTEATHFHGAGVSKEWFLEHIVPNGRFIETIDNTSFYWSPN